MVETFTPEQQEAIEEKIELLKGIVDGSYSMEELSDRITKKRLKWFKEQENFSKIIEEAGSLSLFAFIPYIYTGYMKIDQRDYDKFIWDDEDHGNIYLWIESRGFCPYLEACNELNLDTRIICPGVLQKPVQEIISMVSPRSRFYRFDDTLRPYGESCTEMVALNPTGDEYMKFWEIINPDEHKAMREMGAFEE